MNALDIIVARATPPWYRDAACRTPRSRQLVDAGRANFFPQRGGSAGVAQTICASCPVLEQCRATALANPWMHGIWGGTTRTERTKRSAA